MEFTYFNPRSHSRIDRIYANEHSIGSCRAISTLPFALSDHHAVRVDLALGFHSRGAGRWLFNNSLFLVPGVKEALLSAWAATSRIAREDELKATESFLFFEEVVRSTAKLFSRRLERSRQIAMNRQKSKLNAAADAMLQNPPPRQHFASTREPRLSQGNKNCIDLMELLFAAALDG